MIITGIDPGSVITGYGIIRKTKKGLKCLDYGVIETNPSLPPEQRLHKLHLELLKLLRQYKPGILVVEKVFFFKNLKTAMPVSEAGGVVLLTAAKKKIKVKQLTPLEIKMGICGYGRADKKQVQKMIKEILKLKEIPRPDDAADALATAVCWAYSTKAR